MASRVPRVLKFVVPMPENVTNKASGKSHWRHAHKAKVEYWKVLDVIALSGWRTPPFIVPALPDPPITFATIRSVMHLGGAMDEDNAVARHKPVIDWLRDRGFVVDDRRKNLRWEAFPEQAVKRDGNYRIELTLTEQQL